MPRQSMSKKLRFEVFKRDSFTCQYCGRSAPEVILHVDHIKPVSKDGDSEITNLITACFDCNMGKKDRELSDDAVIQKRKKQLDSLQERREQLEMMVEWQRSLIDITEDETYAAIEFVNSLIGKYSLNDDGEGNIKRSVRKYGIAEFLESARISADQYLVLGKDGEYEQSSVEKMVDYIPRICNSRKLTKLKPYLNDLYYIRGILRRRCYCNDHEALDLLETAYSAGHDIEELKDITLHCRNWTAWREQMEELANG